MSDFKYDGKSRPNSKAYDENYDKIFGKKKKKKEEPKKCDFCKEKCNNEHCHTNDKEKE